MILSRRKFLHLTAGAGTFIGRVGAEVDYSPGTAVRIAFDLASACLFDAVTEQAITT